MTKIITFQSPQVSSGQPLAWSAVRPDLPSRVRAVMPGYLKVPAALVAGDILLVPDHFLPVATRRLVVLVPSGNLDEKDLIRRVWQLAVSSGLEVRYEALVSREELAATERRRLLGLAEGTADRAVRAQINLNGTKSWTQALKGRLEPGDLLVCLADYPADGLYFWRRPMGERLAKDMHIPVYLLSGLRVERAPYAQPWIKETLVWLASFALIAAFFWLQTGIDHTSIKPFSTILLCLALVGELYTLWKVNKWID